MRVYKTIEDCVSKMNERMSELQSDTASNVQQQNYK